jgi:hypothetical protein
LARFPCATIGGRLSVALLLSAHHAVGKGIGSGLKAVATALLLIHSSLLFRGWAAG